MLRLQEKKLEIGMNGKVSNMKMISVIVDNVNEFSLEFEDMYYKVKKDNVLVFVTFDYSEARERFRECTGV
jgi:hypothetical protein